jgi:uncharacterized protein (DUF1684 family)
MNSQAKPIVFLLLAVAVILTIIVVKRIEGPKDYIDSIVEKRHRIDLFMEESPDSPFPAEQRSTFQGLSYFPPDPAYRVQARLALIAGQEEVLVPTSDGTVRRYLRYAWAEFDLQGTRQRLLLLKDRDARVSNRLFLAFRDRTSGKESYGGGRYIDLFQQSQGEITIDFNLAYNPYCVYNYTYSCPLPPEDNRLKVPIPAGEKMYPPAQ